MAKTFRLKLEQEDTGKVLYAWSGITAEKVTPILSALRTFLPLAMRAARAKRAITELLGAAR